MAQSDSKVSSINNLYSFYCWCHILLPLLLSSCSLTPNLRNYRETSVDHLTIERILLQGNRGKAKEERVSNDTVFLLVIVFVRNSFLECSVSLESSGNCDPRLLIKRDGHVFLY
ncbi:hypothetical protein BDC45DRAFT_536825 [Circinella umbellata]|nr:hypothetical protein BDC45DRAFT_536825 [Circinella umbellata]